LLRILFDRYGEQVQVHLSQGGRLAGLFAFLDTAGWHKEIAEGPLTLPELARHNVLALTNRTSVPYTRHELEAIVQFVRDGGGLLCMANQAAESARTVEDQMNNHVPYDSAVASTFFVSFQAAAYRSVLPKGPVILTGPNLGNHPIIRGDTGWPIANGKNKTTIEAVASERFCGIFPDTCSKVIVSLRDLGDSVRDLQDNRPVRDGVVWAVALDSGHVTAGGRVVICADASWVGQVTTGTGDNAQLAANILAWLGKV
jgi:hypothetical protein